MITILNPIATIEHTVLGSVDTIRDGETVILAVILDKHTVPERRSHRRALLSFALV